MEPLKDIVVLYHSNCPDGFTSSYVAWKKFKDTASYIPVHHSFPPPIGLEGKEIYMIDFSYKKDVLLAMESTAKSFVILDHHKTSEEAVKAVKNHRFAKDQSGCGLAWEYFFPDTPAPKLITYIQEGDLNKSTLPNTHEILKVIYITPFTFEAFSKLEQELQDEKTFDKYIEVGQHYSTYFKRTAEILAENATLVSFEGHEVYAVNAPSVFKHEVCMYLWKKFNHPFAIAWSDSVEGYRSVSMRSNDTFDVSELAMKYGGGGHKGASAFRIFPPNPLPFTIVKT